MAIALDRSTELPVQKLVRNAMRGVRCGLYRVQCAVCSVRWHLQVDAYARVLLIFQSCCCTRPNCLGITGTNYLVTKERCRQQLTTMCKAGSQAQTRAMMFPFAGKYPWQ